MILLVLLIVSLFLWFLSLVAGTRPGFERASGWLAFISVVLLFLMTVAHVRV
jgi:hypothetical protein